MDKFALVTKTLKGYLSWAKANPRCAETFYTMAHGFMTGATMALLSAEKDEWYDEVEKLWNEELDPAFKALLKTAQE